MDKQTTAVLIPDDGPIRRSSIKRALLTSEQVVLPPPQPDFLAQCLFPDPKQPQAHAMRGLSGPLPASEGFHASLDQLAADLSEHQGDIGVRWLTQKQFWPSSGIGISVDVMASLTEPSIVRAAVPDYSPGTQAPIQTQPIQWVDGMLLNGAIGVGIGSRPIPASHTLHMEEDWGYLAVGRIARATKYLHHAVDLHAVPVTSTAHSAALVSAILAHEGSGSSSASSNTSALSLSLFDDEIDRALLEQPWSEIRRLRAVTLPAVRELHRLLTLRATAASGASGKQTMRKELAQLQLEFRVLEEQVSSTADALRTSLGLSTLTGLGASGMTTAVSFYVDPLNPHASPALIGAIAGVAGVVATSAKQIISFVQARRAQFRHPLYVIDHTRKSLLERSP